jgi:hypothetical protein
MFLKSTGSCEGFAPLYTCIGFCTNESAIMSKKITSLERWRHSQIAYIDRFPEFIHIFQAHWGMWMLHHICHIPRVYLHHGFFQILEGH